MLRVASLPPVGCPRRKASVFVLVLKRDVAMPRGRAAVILHAGQSFFEGALDMHVIGRNACAAEPAQFITFFVKNRGAPFVPPAN